MPVEALIALIGTLLAALIGMISGVYAVWSQRRSTAASADKAEAEKEKITEEITKIVLERAREEVKSLRGENEFLEGENLALKKRVDNLEVVCEEIKTLRTEHQKAVEENVALKQRMTELEAEQKRLLQLVRRLEDGVRQLCKQVREAGLEPVFTVNEDDSHSK